jgi:hypothetical protein
MSDLAELLARVEAATGPDRKLDCALYCATAESPFENYYPDCVLAVLGGFRARLEIEDVPKLTASLDAALALVERVRPEASVLMGLRQSAETRPWARVNGVTRSGADPVAETIPLALLAALLRALLASPATTSCEGE